MRYPALGKTSSRAVSVPALSGGVNLNDALNLVDDNQMTECKNVWYKDGLLQTRPALLAVSNYFFEETNESTDVYVSKSEFRISDDDYKVFVKKDKENNILKVFALTYGKQIIITTEFENADELPVTELFYTGKKTIGEGVYMLATEKDGLNDLYEMVTAVDGSKTFQKLTADNLYSPTIYINGKGDSYSTLPAATETTYAPASFFEGYSSLSVAWSSYFFTTDGVSNSFTLPISFEENYFSFEYTIPGAGRIVKSETFEITKESNLDYNGPWFGDGVYISTDAAKGQVSFFKKDPADNSKFLPYTFSNALGKRANNLRIKIRPIVNKKTNISGMRFGTWFGGAADGISGGTRLFVAGSKENPNLLMWSDLNNPTYFSENNYAYVGEETQSITALKKQNNMLVVFKEKELFYTVCSEGSSYTAEDVVAGRVIDVSTASATFPMITIHSEIGCDLPESIQICGDRLVWACKDRNVYMLKNANQYSTANITKISDMCGRKLKRANFQKVKSCTCDGYYFLGLGDEVFVLNYDYYYFANLPAYSDSKKSQRKLIWYIWELPSLKDTASTFCANEKYINIYSAGNVDGDFAILSNTLYEKEQWQIARPNEQYCDACVKFDDNKGFSFEKLPINSVFQTKMFDFGAMDRFKKIEQLYMGFGNTSGEVLLEYVTDKGSIDKGAIDITGEADEHSPQYVITKRFLPGVNRALRFGIRVTAKGKVAVDGILIKYKYLGVTR